MKDELQKVAYRKADLHKGFEHQEQILFHDVKQDGYVATEERIAIPKEQEEILRDLLSYLKENNQKALFVVSPMIYDDEYFAKMNYIKDIVEQEGFQYLNMNEVLDYNFATDFLDGAHSNILGAKKCSELLGEVLSQEYGLTDKRDKEGYDSWDKSYKAFMEIYNEVNDNKEKYEI